MAQIITSLFLFILGLWLLYTGHEKQKHGKKVAMVLCYLVGGFIVLGTVGQVVTALSQ